MKQKKIISFLLAMVTIITSVGYTPRVVSASEKKEKEKEYKYHEFKDKFSDGYLPVFYEKGKGITPFALVDSSFTNESLTISNPPNRKPVIKHPNYNPGNGGSLTPSVVNWVNPKNSNQYMAYCIDPGYAGYEDVGGNYTVSIYDFNDIAADNLVYDGGRKLFSDDTLKKATAISTLGYNSRSAAEVLDMTFAESGLANESEFNYLAYLATKYALWTVVRGDRTDGRKITVDDWQRDSSTTYSQAIQDKVIAAVKNLYNSAQTFDQGAIRDVQITRTESALVAGTTDKYESIYTITNQAPDLPSYVVKSDWSAFTPEFKLFDMSDTELPMIDGMYQIPPNVTQFKAVYTNTGGGDFTYQTDLTFKTPSGHKILLYGKASVNNRQSYLLAGNGYWDYATDFEAGNREEEIEKGGLEVFKKDSATNSLLKGAVFSFVDSEGNPISVEDLEGNMLTTLTEVSDGRHIADNLKPGTYYVKETSAPEGYVLINDIFTLEVTDGATSSASTTVYNTGGGEGEIEKQDAITGEGLDGVTFDLYNSQGQLIESGTTDAGGIWTPKNITEPGTYTIIERSTNPKYQLTEPTAQVFTVPESMNYHVIFRDFEWQIVTVYKEDAETGEPIPGVQFQITQIDGKGAWKAVAQTDENGRIVWENVPDGTYMVHEVSTVSGYILDPTPQYVTVRNGQSPSLKFLNSKFPGITITKVDRQTGEVITSPTTFRVEQIDGSYKEDVTTVDGKATLKDLPVGSYKITELSAPDGYVLDETCQYVHLDKDQHVQHIAFNLKTPTVIIEKIDGQTGTPIPGTRFEIRKDGELLGVVETGEDGKVTVGMKGSDLGYLEPGMYSITEIFVPEPWVLPTDGSQHKDIYLGAGDTKSLVFTDLEMPTIIIEKYDEQTGERLPNAQFGIYEQEDLSRPVAEGMTDEDGRFSSGKIKPGTYVIKELNPPPGYMFSDKTNSQRVIVAKAGDGEIIVKVDNIKLPKLIIKKIDKVTQEPLAGFTFRVEEADGTSFEPATVTTDANGIIEIPNLPAGTYKITEIACPSHYILDTTPQIVKMEAGDNKTILFQNIKYPTLVILKINYETQKPIPNTTYKVEYENSTGGTELVGTYRTDENGRITLPFVKSGWYSITETIPAQGMQAPTNPVTRIYLAPGTNSYTNLSQGDVGGNPEGINVTSGYDYPVVNGIVNYPLNSIVVKKADANTGEMLSGATFEISKISGGTSGSNGTLVATVTTDSSGVQVITGLEAGTYVVKETIAPNNYIIAETNMQTVNLKADGTSVVEVIFRNYPYGHLSISKVDAITGEPLAGAKFKVVSADGTALGNTNGEHITNVEGQILISNIPPGTSCVISEIQAPSGYIISESTKTVEIGTDGNTHTVIFKNNPYGSLIISKIDALTGEPLAGARFKVVNGKGENAGTGNGEFVTDSRGEAHVSLLEPDSYVVTEIQAPENYAINTTPKTIRVDAEGQTHTLVFDNQPYGSLVIKKYNGVSKEPLANAEFKVTTSKGDLVGNGNGIYKTDASGTITIPNLNEDTYVIEEIKAPDGFILENQTQTIKVEYGKTHTLDFYNYPKSSIQIIKIDSVTKEPLKDAKFNVYKANGELIGEFTTDGNGLIIIPSLEPGWYKIAEVKAPNGYKISETAKDVELTNNQFLKVTFENEKLAGIVIKKTDDKTGSPLSGAKFMVEKQDGTFVGEYTTDSDGTINIPQVEPGWYVVREKQAPVGYLLDESPKTIEVKANVPTVITFTNKKISGIVITKKDDKTGEPLGGAVFTVTKQNGAFVGEYTTDTGGTINIPNLEPGFYIISEIQAPDGYTISSSSKTVEVTNNDPTIVAFTNKKLTGLQIKKVDDKDGKALAGAVFTVSKQNGETVYPDENGTEFVTDGNGFINIGTLDPGFYIVSEIKAPSGYLLDSTPKTVEVKTNAPTAITFTNKKISGLVITKKDDKTGEPLGGAVFTVNKQDGAYIGEYTTDASGTINIPNLEPAWYVIGETKAPTGYMISESSKTVEVTINDPTIVAFTNKKLTGLQIKKVDDKNGQALAGAVFTVKKQNGETIYTHENGTEFVTDGNGFINIETLDPGYYIITEVKAPDGYILDSTPKTVEVKTNTPTAITFTNKYKSGLQVIKVDEDTNEPLSGARFTVYKKSGDIIGEYTTDANGVFIIDQLENGWYKIAETRAPEGYQIIEEPKDIEITGNEFHKIVFKNKKLSGLIIKKIDSVTEKVLEGARFEVVKVNGEKVAEVITDINGVALVPNILAGTYLVKETKAPDGYVLDGTPKTIEVKADGKSIELVFTNVPQGNLQIKKINSETRQPIENVRFSLTRMNGEKIGEFATNKEGMIYVSSVEAGTYILTEVKAADGYILDGEPKHIEVKEGVPTLIEIENKPVSGLLIVKTDSTTGKPLAGVTFDVRRADGQRVQGDILDMNFPNTPNNSPNKNTTANGDISGSYVTDANGRIQINHLTPGEYHVVETKALDGYILDTDVHSVTITPGKLVSLQLTNTPKAGIRIKKIDSVTKRGIYDVEFRVYDFITKQEVAGPFYTDNNGEIDFQGILPAGKYTIMETREATGYMRDQTPRTIEFKEGQTLEILWENTPIMGQIQITKKSAADNEINGLEAGTPLAGAVFEVYNQKTNTLVDRFESGANGLAISNPLPLGRYIIKETVAPKYYKISTQTLDVELEFSGQILKYEFTNEPANTGVEIKKVGVNEAVAGQEIKYEIKTVTNASTVPLTDFFWRDNLPSELRLNKIVTGTYNQATRYKVMFKTNKNEYRVAYDNLSTTKNNAIDMSPQTLGLPNGEYVTEFMLVFGNVKAGFCQVDLPQIVATVQGGIPNGQKFANRVDVGGKYQGEWVIGNSSWLTTFYGKTGEKLPRTGY